MSPTPQQPGNKAFQVTAIGDRFVPADVFQVVFERFPDISLQAVDIDEEATPEGELGIREYRGDPQKVIELAQEADAVLIHVAPITRHVIESLPNLKLIGTARGGPVNVDVAAATERGIPVVTAPGRNAEAVAELTVALAVMLLRHIPRAAEAGRTAVDLGQSVVEGADFMGHELAGTEIGLVGFGRVGHRVASLLSAFGAHVMVHDPFVEAEVIKAAGCEPVALDELVRRARVVSLHARATAENENLINAERLSSMRRDAVLINTARETLVDENALIDALKEGRIAAAALDVVRPAPVRSAHPLSTLPNCLLLPHVGGATREAAVRGVELLADAIRAFLDGQQLPNVINPEAIEKGG